MEKKLKLNLGEVGFPHAHRFTSSTGIPVPWKGCDGVILPRLIIFEEPGSDYDIHHEIYSERVRNCNGEIYYGDIYKPESLEEIPQMGLLVLENVVTDPGQIQKDWYGLIRFLDSKIAPGGLVLFSDHIYPGSLYLGVPHEEIRKEVSQSDSFEVLYFDPLEKGTVEDHTRALNNCKEILNSLGMMDQALDSGLDELHKVNWHWLILQKK